MATTGESEPAAPSASAPDGAEARPPAPAAPTAPVGPIKRGAALRRELTAKLPPLAVASDSAGAMKVDPDAVDLDADAFIGPLHALVSEGRG
jgi:hypothetical protein